MEATIEATEEETVKAEAVPNFDSIEYKLPRILELIATVLLSVWCLIPVGMTFYSFERVRTGLQRIISLAERADPSYGDGFVYNESLAFYETIFHVMGIITGIFALLIIGFSLYKLVRKKQVSKT
ncbi:MAG: hypothetical protein Q4B54_12235, partial [Coriobacteriales bacterium]|nr:hypothetical protein [Coriobacteriales bacterium]